MKRTFPAARREGRIASLGAMAVLLLALAAAFSAAQCHKPNTRVVIFMQGLYTSLGDRGTQGTLVEDHRFETLKAAFAARGYPDERLLDFSYAGGELVLNGIWKPANYRCARTDRRAADHLAVLEQMLRDYRGIHRDAHFTLVGHSYGGYIAFLAAERDAARTGKEKLDIDVVVTLDAPLKGVSADKKVIFDFVSCDKTYLAGAELVADRLDPAIAATRAAQAQAMAQAGIRLATLGNTYDCLWNTAHCIGGDWIDDSATQFIETAALTKDYTITADALASHDAILSDPTVTADVVDFVGAP